MDFPVRELGVAETSTTVCFREVFGWVVGGVPWDGGAVCAEGGWLEEGRSSEIVGVERVVPAREVQVRGVVAFAVEEVLEGEEEGAVVGEELRGPVDEGGLLRVEVGAVFVRGGGEFGERGGVVVGAG